MKTTCSLFLAACALALALFGAPATATLVGLAAVATRRTWLGAVLLPAASPVALLEYPRRIEALGARLDAGGPGALTTRDLAGIWVLNVGMAAGGVAAGFPEVALETLLLAVPSDGERTFRSGFAMGSGRVRAVVDDYVALAEASGADRVVLPPRRVAFGYEGTHQDWRVALALNPATLDGVAIRDGEGWRLELRARVAVDYHPTYRLPLLPGIVIDEGLYDALEQRGWLHPYTAEWRWVTTQIASGGGDPYP